MQGIELDDRSLIALVAAGDHRAFEALVRRHGPALRRFARALTDDGAADDVTQEALLDAFRGAGGYRGESSVRSWLFTLGRNRAFHHRSAARRRELADSPLLELGLSAGFGQNPESAAEQVERHDAVAAALARLAPEEREVLVLRDVEGLSGEEAASVLGVELPTMKSRLHRARLRFMTALREIGGHDGG